MSGRARTAVRVCAQRLQEAVDAYANIARDGAPFDMGVYAALERSAQPDLAGIGALEPLLELILKAAPQGIVNQKVLAGAVTQAYLFFRLGSPSVCPGLADRTAKSVRVALAHLRRLCQVKRLLVQRSANASLRDIAACKRLTTLFQHESGAEDSPPLETNSEAPLAVTASGRLRRRPTLGRVPSFEDSPPPLRGALAGTRSAAIAEATAASALLDAAASAAFKRRPTLGRVPSFDYVAPPTANGLLDSVAHDGLKRKLAPAAPNASDSPSDTGRWARSRRDQADESAGKCPEARSSSSAPHFVGLLTGEVCFRPAGFRAQSAQVKDVRAAAEAAAKKRKKLAAAVRARQVKERKIARAAEAAARAKVKAARAKTAKRAKIDPAAKVKKPADNAAAVAAKEPVQAAARPTGAAAAGAAAVSAAPAVTLLIYRLMHYKSTGAWACRAAGSQLFQVVIQGHPDAAHHIACGARDRLAQGDAVVAVKAWIAAEKLSFTAAG